jgi:hypothetical protein
MRFKAYWIVGFIVFLVAGLACAQQRISNDPVSSLEKTYRSADSLTTKYNTLSLHKECYVSTLFFPLEKIEPGEKYEECVDESKRKRLEIIEEVFKNIEEQRKIIAATERSELPFEDRLIFATLSERMAAQMWHWNSQNELLRLQLDDDDKDDGRKSMLSKDIVAKSDLMNSLDRLALHMLCERNEKNTVSSVCNKPKYLDHEEEISMVNDYLLELDLGDYKYPRKTGRSLSNRKEKP